MAGLFLDQLPLITLLTGTELALVQQGSTTGRIDVQAIANLAPVGSSLAIGNPVGGGTPHAFLFVDAGGLLGNNPNFQIFVNQVFFLDPGVSQAEFNNGGEAAHFNDFSGHVVILANGAFAGSFTDGTRTVAICDGTNNVLYTPAVPANWTTVPTDVWIALDQIAAVLAGLGFPP